MIPKLQKEYLEKFVKDKQDILAKIFSDSWIKLKGKNEIPQLQDFLCNKEEEAGLQFINLKLKELDDENLSIRINSVFSHGSPKVTFDFDGNECIRELADLLTIIRVNYKGPTNSYTYFSSGFFSQWKLNMEDNKNKGQEHLYDKATNFLMPIWIGGQNRIRCFGNNDEKHMSLNFFFIKDKIYSKRPNGTNVDFCEIMIESLKLNYGLEFDEKIWSNPTKSLIHYKNWDLIMHDLINIVGRKPLNIKDGGGQPKLFEFKISDEIFNYEIDNEFVLTDTEIENDKRFQSMIIIDLNFNITYKIAEILKG